MRMSSLFVHELFVSIQGESSWSGSPCFFIRLAGCNLRCRYCDTLKAQRRDQGTAMRIDAIVQACREQPTPLIAVTGGEPMMQPECPALIASLLTLPNRTVMVETNGTLNIHAIPATAIAVMDVKCPGSGEADAMDWSNIDRLRPHDEIKFVLCDRADYRYALDRIEQYHLAGTDRQILFSPAAGRLTAGDLAQWLIADRPPVRLQVQLHRLLGIR